MKYFLIAAVILTSCTEMRDKKLIEKERNLNNYYQSELHTNVPDNGIIIILQNQRCSSCRRTTFNDLADFLIKSNFNKHFIISKTDTSLTSIIQRIPRSKIQIDVVHKLSEYGLDYGSDLFFLFRDGKLSKWFEISNKNLENLKSID